ncbi:MAG TPA: AAA family ATPase [Blastocatellia bacterium]
MRLIIENVRSFAGRHEIPIKPLTILTGENSSGKTTLLGCLAAVSDPVGFPLNPKFDAPPYDLGSYDTIATNKGGRPGIAESFSIGWADGPGESHALATYENQAGVPRLRSFHTHAASGEVSMTLDEAGKSYRVFQGRAGDSDSVEFAIDEVWGNGVFASALTRSLSTAFRHESGTNESPYMVSAPFIGVTRLEKTASIAVIRARPKRTYDPATFSYSPDGSHIPHVLARLTDPGYDQEWKQVQRDLEQFGMESGLFSGVKVKHLGKAGADPFQILVKVGGAWINWADVGCSVSQILPVVVESLFPSGPSALLIQQPELDLHPEAQAALGSFFARVTRDRQATEQQISFAIETHSDYLADRVRMQIADGTIDHRSVVILYVEKKGRSARVHPLGLDSIGNILDAPPTYRQFFLREELALLTRAH